MKTELNFKPSGLSYLLVGSGRLATHLTSYFSALGITLQTWNRKNSTTSLKEALSKKPIVLLAISDGSLDSFFKAHLQDQDLKVVHFSGAFHSEQMISCHPLMTFGKDLYPLETYKKIFFAVTGSENLQNIFPFLPNTWFQLAAKDKPLYHALCVLSAAGAQTIWSLSEKILSEIKVPAKALNPYIKQIADNYIASGSEALTGPWIRGDEKTIAKNLNSLSERAKPLDEVYQLLKEGRYDNP